MYSGGELTGSRCEQSTADGRRDSQGWLKAKSATSACVRAEVADSSRTPGWSSLRRGKRVLPPSCRRDGDNVRTLCWAKAVARWTHRRPLLVRCDAMRCSSTARATLRVRAPVSELLRDASRKSWAKISDKSGLESRHTSRLECNIGLRRCCRRTKGSRVTCRLCTMILTTWTR